MKTGRTLPELAAELERQSQVRRDFLAPADALKVESNGHSRMLLTHADSEAFEVNGLAHAQIADYLAVPRAFYEKLRLATHDLRVPMPLPDLPHGAPEHAFADERPLFDVLVNRMLASKRQDGRLVRTLDGRVRAFLSDTYNPDLDHFSLYQVVARVLTEEGLGPEDVLSTEVTDSRLYIKVVSPRLQAEIRPSNLQPGHPYLKEPQVVQAGFLVTNSETGQGALRVQQMVYKLMCQNGWIKEEAFRQRHVGRALEADDDGVVYQSDTRQADAKARLLKIRDHVADALSNHKFRQLVGKMQETTEIRLEGPIEKVVEVTARKFGLQPDEREDVLRNLIEGADLSLWGLSNALTATAQGVQSYDRSTELEAVGGRFFTLPTTDIREIVRAVERP